MAATKYWLITGTGDWSPAANTPVSFQGNVGSNGITGVSASVVSAINAIGATGVNIINLGINVASASGSTITLGATYTGGLTGYQNNLSYYNIKKPAQGVDGPIVAILPIDSTPEAIALQSPAGLITTFPAGSLKQGAIYPFAVNTITTVTSGDFIGLSEY